MATSDALIKYYDCLKDSFNKIQVKDNKAALVNAALRPKIREEFDKSKDVLKSYLNYIQVFTLIYSEKFNNICMSILCPILREQPSTRRLAKKETISRDDEKIKGRSMSSDGMADQIHETMEEILKSRPDLAEEFVHCLTKTFPTVFQDENDETFLTYLGNCLEVCSYIDDGPLANLTIKILDRINPPPPIEMKDEEALNRRREIIDRSYELLYDYLDICEKPQLDNVAKSIVNAFVKEFLASDNEVQLNYLLLHICSLDEKLSNHFIDLLWKTFNDSGRAYDERRSSVYFASSFMSRASYIDLDRVFEYLETACAWCNEHIANYEDFDTSGEQIDLLGENVKLFYDLVQSIFYLVTQRYREMYEAESILRLKDLNLESIITSPLKPLEACDFDVEQRFCEVATLYQIVKQNYISRSATPSRKRRKSTIDSKSGRISQWKVPYEESSSSVPKRVLPIYKSYYNHRNFTIYRE